MYELKSGMVVRGRWLVLLIAFLGAMSSAADELVGDDWPQWRGPSRDGHVQGEAWPASLDQDHLRSSWRIALGPSYSGPIVVGDSVFTTETREKMTEVVLAYDRRTGQKLWETEWPGAMRVPFFAAANGSWIRATPACDGQTLFVAGMRDELVALDATTGEKRWSVDFKKEFETPLPSFGFASSPIVHGNAVYVQAGGGFVKLDKRTGEVIWRAATDGGGMFGSAFSSPFFVSLEGQMVALVQTRSALKGIVSDSGKELWSQPIDAFRGMNILTPVVYQGTVFTSAHSGRSQLWQLTSGNALAAKGAGLDQVWSNKSQAYMSSPVVVGDHLYMHLRNQRIQCVDLQTGEETWRTKPFGKYQSMVVIGDRILALDQRGELLLFYADPDGFRQIDGRKISEDETWAHVAVCGGQVFVRELNALAVYTWR